MPKVGVSVAVFDKNNKILCVKIIYVSSNWTLPSAHLENNESPYDCVKREVLEEAGYIVDIENLKTVFSAPQKNDIVFLFKARIEGQIEWKPNNEIEQIDFFERNALPAQIHPWNIKRINDAYENKISNLWIFE